MVHELKLQQPYFDDVYFNKKEFEVRLNDRDFKIGDTLKLLEYPFDGRQRYVLKEIKYIFQGGQHGVAEDTVILGLKDVMNSESLADILKRDLEDKVTFTLTGKGRV